MIKLLSVLLSSILLISCAEITRRADTAFELAGQDAEYRYYRYKGMAGFDMPLSSESAEETRIEWLETWLEQNGLPADDYEIVERTPLLRGHGLLGDGYDVYYKIRIKKP